MLMSLIAVVAETGSTAYMTGFVVLKSDCNSVSSLNCKTQRRVHEFRGAKQGGGGVGGSQPPLNFRWGVEHLSTPLILRRFLLGRVGSP